MIAAAMTTEQQVALYATTVWQDDDLIEIRPLPAHLGQRVWIPARDIPSHIVRMQTENDGGANVYAGILPRLQSGGGRDEDCAGGWCIWADLDGIQHMDATQKAAVCGLPPPSMVVDSGHGTHLYWALKDREPPDRLSRAVWQIAQVLDSDASVRNPSRILRLPGYWNHKPPKAWSEVIVANPGTRYGIADIERVVGTRTADPAPAPQHTNNTAALTRMERLALVERARNYVSTVEGSAPGGRTHKAFRIAAILTNDYGLSDEDALPLLTDWDDARNQPPIANDPQYGVGELKEILANARRYAKTEQYAPGNKAAPSNTPPTATEQTMCFELPNSDPVAEITAELDAEARGERKVIRIPWAPRLSKMSKLLRPRCVNIIGGPEGNGKTHFALGCGLAAEQAGMSWMYVPLEGTRVEYLRRIAAANDASWDAMEDELDDPDAHRKNRDALARQVGFLHRIGQSVLDPLGSVGWQEISARAANALKDHKVAIVDPYTYIQFGGRRQWEEESRLMSALSHAAQQHNGTVLLVVHTVKRPGRDRKQPLTAEDLQGGSDLRRMASAIVLLDTHERKNSEVYRAGGGREIVNHNRTVIIDKSRFGNEGKGQRLAFEFGVSGPSFRELGIIVPKSQRMCDEEVMSY